MIVFSADSHAQIARDLDDSADSTGAQQMALPPGARSFQAQADAESQDSIDDEDGSVYIQIVGGEEATPGAYPFQVFLYIDERFICGGTLIAPQWVLTAAHCVKDGGDEFAPETIVAMLGKHELGIAEASQQVRVVEEIFVHPDYNDDTDLADMALLRLEYTADLTPRIAPVELLQTPLHAALQAPDEVATVIGWGTTEYQGEASPLLLEVDVPIVSQSTCQDSYAQIGVSIFDEMLCAGLETGGKDACQGDSGGPLLVPNPDGGWLQSGVVSFGFECAVEDFYGVYTRVSSFTDWVADTLAAHSPPMDTENVLTPAIRDGDFAAGSNDEWSEEASGFSGPIIVPATAFFPFYMPFNGPNIAWLVGGPEESASLAQEVDFPEGATELRYYYWIHSEDACDVGTAWVAIDEETVAEHELCEPQNTNRWREARVDLEDFRGQSATLAFHAATNDSATSTRFFLDGVKLFAEPAPPPEISIGDVQVEARSGITTLTVLTASLDAPYTAPVSVAFETQPDTAESPADYLEKSGVLTFAPGEVEQTLALSIVGNPGPGAQKSFTVQLSDPVNGVLGKDVAQVVILGTDPTPEEMPRISIADATVVDGDVQTPAAEFRVWLSHTSPHTVTVDYATEDATAIAPQDYLSKTGTLVFAPGHITRTIPVTIVNNLVNSDSAAIAGDRRFTVTLSNPSQASLLRSQATGIILDEDAELPVLTVEDGVLQENGVASDAGGAEDDPNGSMRFQVSLSTASAMTVSVAYHTQDGGAVAPDHYLAASGVLTFAPGVVSQTVAVEVLGNTTPQPSITFTLILTEPVNAVIGAGVGVGVLVNESVTPLQIDEFSPTSGAPGTVVTIHGQGFANVTRVYFGSVPAAFNALSDTVLVVQVPEGAGDGPIVLETPAGIVESSSAFTVALVNTLFVPQILR